MILNNICSNDWMELNTESLHRGIDLLLYIYMNDKKIIEIITNKFANEESYLDFFMNNLFDLLYD